MPDIRTFKLADRQRDSKRVSIVVQCPHCAFEANQVPYRGWPVVDNHPDAPHVTVVRSPDHFDPRWNDGEGAFVTRCVHCGREFSVPADSIRDLQHACLVLLGEI